MTNYKSVTAKELSDLGLLFKINKEILHPLGLAIGRDSEDEDSFNLECIMVSDTLEYSDDVKSRNLTKLENLDMNLSKLKVEKFNDIEG